MNAFRNLLLTGGLVFSLASPAAATGDWLEDTCKEFLDHLEASIGEYDDDDGDTYARSAYLSYQHSYWELKLKECLKALYNGDDHTSPHYDDDGHEWLEAWLKHH